MNATLHQNTFCALAYAARGWAVYPLAPGAKQPLKGSHGLTDATTDAMALARMVGRADLNLGIRTGQISNLVVVDVDCHPGSPDGRAALRELAQDGMALPTGDAATGCGIVSTPSGGWHLYFRPPVGVKLKNSSGKIAPGIDVRGEGGYVVAPPSRTAAGPYRWVQYPAKLSLAPEWLVERCRVVPPPPRMRYRAKPSREMPGSVAEVLRDRLERIANAPAGTRNETLNREAFYLAGFLGSGFGVDELDGWLMEAAEKAGLPGWEARRTVESALSSQRRVQPGTRLRAPYR